jgi:hypothetical protein
MDLVVDEELFAIETINSSTQFLMNKLPERTTRTMHPTTDERNSEDVDMDLCNKRRYTFYSDDEKSRFFSFIFFSKCSSASVAARKLDIHVRAAQRWVKRYYENPRKHFRKEQKKNQTDITF